MSEKTRERLRQKLLNGDGLHVGERQSLASLLRDGPDGERGGLEPWMVEELANLASLLPPPLQVRYNKIATAIRNILEAK